jgi:hypothetical protein
MDADARDALASFDRQTIRDDLDVLARHLQGEGGRLHHEVIVLRQLAGLRVEPLGRAERMERVVELRRGGPSMRGIATALGVNRWTVAKDLRALQAPSATVSVGVDGYVCHHQAASPPV